MTRALLTDDSTFDRLSPAAVLLRALLTDGSTYD